MTKAAASHVAAVLQQRQAEIEDQQHRQEHQNPTHAGHHPFDQQREQPGRGRDGRQPGRRPVGQHAVDRGVDPVHEGGRDVGGQLEDQRHQQEEDGQAQHAVRHHVVDAVGQAALAQTAAALDHLVGQAMHEAVAPVGHQQLHVIAVDDLHAGRGLLGQLAQSRCLRRVAQRLRGQRIALQQLDGGIARRGRAEQRGHLPLQGSDLLLHLVAVVHHLGVGRGLGHGQTQQLQQALAARADRGNHRHAQQPAEQRHVDGAALGLDPVHHVQRQGRRHAQLQHLHRQVEVALQVGGVGHDDGRVGPLLQDEVARDHLLQRVRAEAVGSRQVNQRHLAAVPAHRARLDIHGLAGPVAHVLSAPGQCVEDGAFAGIRVARQGHHRPGFSFAGHEHRRRASAASGGSGRPAAHHRPRPPAPGNPRRAAAPPARERPRCAAATAGSP